MGMILEQTPEMGEFHVEVRRESFYIGGESNWTWCRDGKKGLEVRDSQVKPRGKGWELRCIPRRHAIFLYHVDYPQGVVGQGTAEILIEDIPKIRACLDAIEAYRDRTVSRLLTTD